MLSTHYALFFIVAFVFISGIGFSLIRNLRKNLTIKIYFGYTLVIAGWLAIDIIALLFTKELSAETQLFLYRLKGYFWMSVAFFFLHFVHSFFKNKKSAIFFGSAGVWILSMIALTLELLNIIPGWCVTDVEVFDWGIKAHRSYWYPITVFMTVILPFSLSIYMLWTKMESAKNELHKNQLTLLLMGTFTMMVTGMASEMIYLLIDIQAPKVTVFSSVIQAIFILYAIYRFNFFSVRSEFYTPNKNFYANDALFTIDSDCKIIHANDSAIYAFKLDESSIEKLSLKDLFSAYDFNKNYKNVSVRLNATPYLISDEFVSPKSKDMKVVLFRDMQQHEQITEELAQKNSILARQIEADRLRTELWKIASDETIDENTLISRLLEKAASLFTVCRALYFIPDSENEKYRSLSEWKKDGMKSLLNLRIKKFLLEKFEKPEGVIINIEDILENVSASEKNSAEKLVMSMKYEYDIHKLLIIDCSNENQCGLLVFASCENDEFDFSDIMYNTALDMAKIISQTLQRIRTKKNLDASQQQVKGIMNSLPEIIFEVDMKGGITFLNSYGLRFFGIKEEEISAAYSIFDMMVEENRAKAKTTLRAISIYKKVSNKEEYALLSKDGSVNHFSVYATLLLENGEICGIRGFAVNINNLKEIEKKYEETVEMLPSIVIETNLEFDISYMNKTGMLSFGYNQTDIDRGINFFDLFRSDEKDSISTAVKENIESEGINQMEFVFISKDGNNMTMLVRFSVIMQENSFKGLRCNINDITQRRKAEEELRVKTKELEIINRIIRICGEVEEIDSLMDGILSIIFSKANFSAGGVYLLSEDKKSAELKYHKGFNENEIDEIKNIDTASNRYFRLFQNGEAIISMKKSILPGEKTEHYKSCVMLPLENKGETGGAFVVVSREESAYTQSEINLFRSISKEISSSIAKVESGEYTKSIETALQKKRESIKSVQSLQKNLNTNALPRTKEYSISASYMPSEELGGDFFTVEQVGDKIIVIMADCVGHGIKASLSATLLKSITDRYIGYLPDGATDFFLERVNREVVEYFYGKDYPTMFVCVIDTLNHELYYSHANSPRPYVVDNGKVEMLEKTKGTILGLNKNIKYETKKRPLEEGEIVVIYSDAFLGVLNEDEIVYDSDDFEESLKKFGQDLKINNKILFNDISAVSPLPVEDDATLVMIERIPEKMNSFTIKKMEEGIPIVEEIEKELMIRGYDEDERATVAISFEEIYVNAIDHGNKNDPNKSVYIHYMLNCEFIMITVGDEGEGFNPEDVPDPTKHELVKAFLEGDGTQGYVGGRGIWIARKMLDSIEYNKKGNEVNITKLKHYPRTSFMYSENPDSTDIDYTLIADTAAADYEISGKIVWHKYIDINKFEKIDEDDIYIDFGDLSILSSTEVSNLLSIVRICSQQNKKLKLLTSKQRLRDMMSEMAIDSFENVIVI